MKYKIVLLVAVALTLTNYVLTSGISFCSAYIKYFLSDNQ